MSNPVTKLFKQKKFSKNKKYNNSNQNTNNKINPNFINFIKGAKREENSDKNKNISENIFDSLIKQKEQKNYLEENNKEVKLGAQKGLLFLLNELSQGKFFPEINDFFDKMKDIKLDELRMKSKSINQINEASNIKTEEYLDINNSKNTNNIKNVSFNIQIQNNENKTEENSENKNNKSVPKKRKILKGKTNYKNKNNIAINYKSFSKKDVKDNIGSLDNSNKSDI